jgi:TP901 family phage tail tape measure protein
VALSTHELILVLRARDEASRVLRNIEGNINGVSTAQQAAARRTINQGAALTTVGVGLAAAGIAGMKALNGAVDAAVEYNRTVALTKTQVDDVKISLQQLGDEGLKVAKAIPVPFEQIQPMLYDIFSSMTVNLAGADKLITQFSRDAVAGQVDLHDAGRANIGIMNSYHLAVGRAAEVSDFMFQLVRKGVGTYGEFASTIGRSIPSAVRAGQTYQQLGGMLAFLTRNGLSTAMATASAGRALDAISNPKTVTKLKDFGDTIVKALGKHETVRLFGENFKKLSIDVKDAHGNFLPMTVIMQRLSDVIAKLPAPQRAAVLQELFKGSGGTIQARRFFDVAIPGIKQFTQLTNDMYNSRGAADAAYKTMLETPAMRAKLLSNRFQALRVEIGQYLIPVQQALVGIGLKVIDFWNRLDPAVRKNIVVGAAIAAAVLTVIGVVTALAGVILMVRGAFMLMGTSITAMTGPIGLTILAVAALAAGFIYLYNHSETFRNAMNAAGGAIKDAGVAVVNATKVAFGWTVNTGLPWIKSAWSSTLDWLHNAWNNMVGWWHTAADGVSRATHAVFDPVLNWLKARWQDFMNWYHDHTEEFQTIWKIATNAWKLITMAWTNWALPFIRAFWGYTEQIFRAAWSAISGIVKVGWDLIKGYLNVGMIVLRTAWNIFWAGFKYIATVAWSAIYNGIAIVWHLISGLFTVMLDLLTGHWSKAWQDLKRTAQSIWGNLKDLFSTWAHAALDLLKSVGSNLWHGLIDGLKAGVGAIVQAAKDLGSAIVNAVKDFFGIHSPSTVMMEIGGHLVSGLAHGLLRANPIALIGKVFGGFPAALASMVTGPIGKAWQLTDKARGALAGFFGSGGGGAGSAIPGLGGVKQWDNVILAALGALGLNGDWLATVERRMARESGGNPRAINNWDINAQNGDPSRGLMQVIGSTFAAYAGPFGARGIWDPLANVYAGLNYALHRYGTLAALDRPGGYLQGAWDTGPYAHMALIHPREMVIPRQDAEAIRAGANNGRQPTNITIYTNEIDPTYHSQQLAWELDRRVG